MTFNEAVEREFSEGISVNPAEKGFAVNLFGFEFSGMAVEVLDRFHGIREPCGGGKVKAG